MSQQTNSGTTSRLFVQEGVGGPLVYVGCVGVRGVVVDPRQVEFVRCVSERGVDIDTIKRYPNPQPFDVTFGANYRKWNNLFKNTGKGCKPNFFLAMAYCEDASRISDPTYLDDGLWLYNVEPNTGYQVHNNTAITLDPNTSVRRDDQISFISTEQAFVAPFNYVEKTDAPADIASLAVLDSGVCSDFVCRACDAEGCQTWLATTGSVYMYTVDGGANWSNIAAVAGGIAQSFNGNGFMVQPAAIKISSDVTLAAALWTSASTDVAFAGLCNIAQIDPQTLIVGGSDYQVWRSKNGGGSWVQVKAAEVGGADFKAMGYNSKLQLLVGILVSGTDISIAVSSDRGKSWTTVTPDPVTGETAGVNSNYIVQPMGDKTFLVINGNLYVLSCTNCNTLVSSCDTTYTEITIVGASGLITGIAAMDPIRNGNQGFLTTSDGKVFKTNDGFNTAAEEAMAFTISTADTVLNPIALCHGKYGDGFIAGFGVSVVEWHDWESFFEE